MLAGGEFVGGVCGENTGDVDSCFWDMQVSTVSMSAGGSGLTTAEMQQVATFTSAGWDFVAESVNGAVDIWNMDDYPVLSGISFSVVPADGFTAWLSLAGVPLALSGEADTPALDGIPNLLKYACGLSVSTTYASADLYTMSLDEPGLFSIIYFKSKAATGVMLEAVWASTLAGPWTNTGVSYELLSDDGSREQWRASIRMENHGFMRLMAALVE
jgi:hypothetical protein